MRGDNEMCLVLVWTILIIPVVLLASPFLVWFARRGGEERRTKFARAVLVGGLVALWWLDAVVVVMTQGIEEGSPLSWHLRAASFFGLLWLAIVPLGRGRRLRAALGACSFFAFALAISFVPWNVEKQCALDVRRIAGQPLATVQRVMGEYAADVRFDGGETYAERLGDVDLAALAPRELVLEPLFGGCSVEIVDGRVGQIYFVYD